MFLMRFTERAYVAYTEEDVRNSFRSSVRLTFPKLAFQSRPGLGHVQRVSRRVRVRGRDRL